MSKEAANPITSLVAAMTLVFQGHRDSPGHLPLARSGVLVRFGCRDCWSRRRCFCADAPGITHLHHPRHLGLCWNSLAGGVDTSHRASPLCQRPRADEAQPGAALDGESPVVIAFVAHRLAASEPCCSAGTQA